MYNDALSPRWEVYRDQFNEGMAEEDPAFASPPRPNVWQPRRGFGMLWRSNSVVRNRIGWATIELEIPYSVQVQTSANGTLFLSEPGQGVFAVLAGGQTWARYAGFVGP
jgi:hypothetical protein